MISWKVATALAQCSVWWRWTCPSLAAGGRSSLRPGSKFTSEKIVDQQNPDKIKISWSGRKRFMKSSLLSGYGGHSSTRRSTFVTTEMDGMPMSTCPGTCGGAEIQGTQLAGRSSFLCGLYWHGALPLPPSVVDFWALGS